MFPNFDCLQIAKEEEKGVYLNFLNFLVNDSIYLLDESLNKILEIKKIEAEMSNTAEWEQRPAQERQDRTRLFHSQENVSGLHFLYHVSNSIHDASKNFILLCRLLEST